MQGRIEALGGTYSPKLWRGQTQLVIADSRANRTKKVMAAVSWGIPAVTVEWLAQVERDDAWCPYDDCMVDYFREVHMKPPGGGSQSPEPRSAKSTTYAS